MIDTATIILIGSNNKQFYDIIKSRGTAKDTWPHWIDKSQTEQGITYTAVHQEIVGRPTSYIVLAKLSMRKLLDKPKSIDLASEQDYPKIEERVEDLLKAAKMPSFSHWQASRVDFCCNVHTPYVKLYLKLLKRGINPRYYRDLYDPDTGKHKQRKGSLYLVPESRDKKDEETGEFRTGPKKVNFYDKLDELTKKGVTDAELLEQAKDVLRLEVQVLSPRLRAIRRRDSLPDMSLKSFFSEEIGTREIALMLKNIMGVDCPYYSTDKALELIQERKRMHQTTKDKLSKMIKAIARNKEPDAWNLGEYIRKHQEEWQSCIQALKNLGVNPVTISKRDSVGIKGKMIPSPLRLFLDAVNASPNNIDLEEALEAPQEEPEEKEIEPWSAEEIDMLFADIYDD